MSLKDKIAAHKKAVTERKNLQRERSVSGTNRSVAEITERKASLAERLRLAQERSRKAAEVARSERLGQYRGVDRVPNHLKNLGDSMGKVIVEHADADYRTRRISAQGTGRTMRPGMNEPYRNPERANRKRGKRRTGNR